MNPITLSASVVLRPTRIGFLVRPDDLPSVRRIMQICTCLWGGVYNPIIPVCKSLPEVWPHDLSLDQDGYRLAKDYIDFFEPDVFVEAEAGLADELGLSVGQLEINQPRTVNLDAYLTAGELQSPRSFGTNIFHVYQHLYQREFRFVARDEDRVALMNAQGDDAAFIEAAFGAFPTDGAFSELSESYQDAFKPKVMPATPDGFLRLIKEGFRFPLFFTTEGLNREYGKRNRDRPLIFIADPTSPFDLVDLWNLRLLHPAVIPMNLRWFHDCRDFVAEFIRKSYRPLPGNSHGVMIIPTLQFGRSIGRERAEEFVRAAELTSLEGSQFSLKSSYDRFMGTRPDETASGPRPVKISAATADHDLAIRSENDRTIVFPSLSPEFAPIYDDFSARWVNVVRIENFSSDDRLALVLPSSFNDEIGINYLRYGEAIIVAREGFVLTQRNKGDRNRFQLMHGVEAITIWLKSRGIEASVSDSGRITEQVLSAVCGVRASDLIADRETLKLLDNMAKSIRRYSDGTTEEFEDRAVSVTHFKQVIQRRAPIGLTRRLNLDAFVTANIIRLGLSLICPSCAKKNWIGIPAISEVLVCDRCLKSFPFPQGTLDFDKTPWQYRVVGPFSVPDYARGAYATVLALRLFLGSRLFGGAELTYATGLDLKGVCENPIEIDFIFWYRPHELFRYSDEPVLVFGEAKSFAEQSFKPADIQRIDALSEKFPDAFIVFACLKDDLSADEKAAIVALIKKMVNRNKSVRTRAPLIILTGIELFARLNLNQAWKDKGGQHALFSQQGSIQLGNLWTLAECTQQLYLGL